MSSPRVLYLLREDANIAPPLDAAAELVAAIDRSIDGLPKRPLIPVESRPPYQTPVIPGRLQRFDNFAGDARTTYRYESAFGTPITVNVPTCLVTPEFEAWLAQGCDMLEREEREG